jgi:hypothetical protein
MAPFAGGENENEGSGFKTGEKLAIEKIHVADSRDLAAISSLRSWRLNSDFRLGER